jgi:hypothetical protein
MGSGMGIFVKNRFSSVLEWAKKRFYFDLTFTHSLNSNFERTGKLSKMQTNA